MSQISIEASPSQSSTEIEYKFENLSNTQFKFSVVDDDDELFQKLSVLCRVLDIKFLPELMGIKIVDEYFDDENNTLKNNNCILRRRTNSNRKTPNLTFKAESKQIHNTALCRREHEIQSSNAVSEAIISNIKKIENIFESKLGAKVKISTLSRICSVHNTRSNASIETDNGKYKLSYDRYYYFNPANGDYSHRFAEVEIEIQGAPPERDAQILKLSDALSGLLGYRSHKDSKGERGLQWTKTPLSDALTVNTVAFDIIGYSKKTADIQKSMVQIFNNQTRRVIDDIVSSKASKNLIYIPTGDGMIIPFERNATHIIPIIFELQKRIRIDNSARKDEERFEFRTGIHSGLAFKYMDVNENVNFAGSGINLAQRAMSFGDEWHIVATDAAYAALAEATPHIRSHWHEIGTRTIKHGQKIKLYNIFDRLDGVGNPKNPS